MARLTAKCGLVLCILSLASPGFAGEIPRVRPVRGFRQYVVKGQLTLSVRDAVRLMLLNNSNVRVDREAVKQARDAVVRSHAPFDPLLSSSVGATRQTEPEYSQLSGASTLSDLSQNLQAGYQQLFSSGATFQTQFQTQRSSTNNSFNFLNPVFSSSVSFSINQPLLRNRGVFVNRAPILIAQRNLDESKARFRQQMNDAIQQVVGQYWQVVLDHESLEVLKQSYQAAQASYAHDELSLKLGALSPLGIFQSEAEVASRKVSVIQAQYALKQDENQLRLIMGADLDPAYATLGLNLTDSPKPSPPLRSVDVAQAIQMALAERPDVAALERQLESNNFSLRQSRNLAKPQLGLQAQYSASGIGGNEVSTTGPPTIISHGGLSNALGQVFGFGYPTYGVSLQLNLPIRNHAAEANLADARVAKEETLYQIRATKEQARLEVLNAVNQLEQAKLSMKAAEVARNLAKDNVAAQEREYRLGSGYMLFVLDAQTQLAQAEQSLVQAQVNYQIASVAVDHATGALLDRYRVKITP